MPGYVCRADLDALFMARVNTARADVGYAYWNGANWIDLAQYYEPIGAGTPIAATGYYTGSWVDLASLFRDKNQPLPPTGPTVALPANGYMWVKSNGTPATLNFNNTGTISHVPIASGVVTHTWLTGGSASQVDMFITVNSGAFSSGSAGVWLNLGTTQTFTRGAAAGANQSVLFTLSFRNASTLAALGSANSLSLQCNRA